MCSTMGTHFRTATTRAIEFAGGTCAVANHLRVSPAAVSQWLMRDKVPAERVRDLEKLCQGRVTRYQLRPDVFGRRP